MPAVFGDVGEDFVFAVVGADADLGWCFVGHAAPCPASAKIVSGRGGGVEKRNIRDWIEMEVGADGDWGKSAGGDFWTIDDSGLHIQ